MFAPAADARERVARVRARALDELRVDDGPRVCSGGHGVAVEVSVGGLPEDVVSQNRGGNQTPKVPRGDELLTSLRVGEVAGDDERTRGGA